MSKKRYYWLKLEELFFDDVKIKKLRSIAGGDTYTIIYLKMLLKAIKNDGYIEYIGVETTFAEELALDINEKVDDVEVTLSYLHNKELIESSDNINFYMPYAAENLGSESAVAQRVREHRDKMKLLQCNTDVTNCNNSVTDMKQNCNTEIEKEKEIDITNTSSKDSVLVRQTFQVRPAESHQDKINRVIEAWNSLQYLGIACISRISTDSKRYKALVARLSQYSVDDILVAVENVRQSDFLQGKNKQGWVITFDWFIKPNNFPKVFEGNYKNYTGAKSDNGKNGMGHGTDYDAWINQQVQSKTKAKVSPDD